jgi:hypothetical protein
MQPELECDTWIELTEISERLRSLLGQNDVKGFLWAPSAKRTRELTNFMELSPF